MCCFSWFELFHGFNVIWTTNMAEDAPYIVYVPVTNSKAFKSALEHNSANGAEAYAEEEYLDSSNEENGGSSDSEDEVPLNEVEMSEPGLSVKLEPGLSTTFKWTHPATIHLIEAYQSFGNTLISGQLTMSQVFDEIAGKLQTRGYNVTPLQCKNKFGNLKQIYEKTKEQEINSGVPAKRWVYMDFMEPIMTEMEKYRTDSNEAQDSPKCTDVKQQIVNSQIHQKQPKSEPLLPYNYKWEPEAIHLLIEQYRKYQVALEAGSMSQKVLFRFVEKNMQNAGYNVTAKQCMVKYHSLRKTYKSMKAYNQENRLIPRRWRYYDLIDSIVNVPPETSNYDPLEEEPETFAEIKTEDTAPSHVFKWSRKAIEILVSAYRERRPPLYDTKATRHKMWHVILQKLRKAGYKVTSEQCRTKISGMLKLYKKNKDGSNKALSERGGHWYSTLIESLVDEPIPTQQETPKTILSNNSQVEDVGQRPDTVLDQLIISEANRERRHRENMEQRQQLIDLMGQLLERLS